jgi:DNA-binding NarL/FixJ family response regulator
MQDMETANAMRKGPARGAPAKRRVLMVDAHARVRRGVSALINNEPDLSVCAEAATQRAALEAIASADPDLVIADLSFEDGACLDFVKEVRLRHPDLPLLLVSIHVASIYAECAFQAGASGYVTKQELNDTLLIAIRRVLDGEQYLSPQVRSGRARR